MLDFEESKSLRNNDKFIISEEICMDKIYNIIIAGCCEEKFCGMLWFVKQKIGEATAEKEKD